MKPHAALVTGSARGIGRGVALALAEAGYSVAVHYRSSADDAAETVRLCLEAGVEADAFQADLTSADEAAALVAWAHTRFDLPLGVLVNVVGNYVHRRWDETTLAEWHDMFDSNLNAAFYTCRAAVPLMRGEGGHPGFGRIVNFGYAGAQSLLSRPGVVPYAVSKAGVIALTKAIARTEAKSGISANVVSPGVIETSVSQPLTEIPAGRLGTVAEVASAVMVFVEGSAYLTGQVLEVAGGWNL
ncbi:bifunctional dihydropteridine reductase/dihydrofolate reductase TmpR [Deinococcus alpinitundrae]|uniref:bifunctional dihydropteridine reductase/dihydrofolate reductase TmpR n=1 Tax=Deinococcus alpinitundrae TaxID=468913 RepID=UPI00137B2C88|nr:bifunctional dihydropteridine reductase/dihydrofolate reductase TmpR [Deinococcus alpinitundrae]